MATPDFLSNFSTMWINLLDQKNILSSIKGKISDEKIHGAEIVIFEEGEYYLSFVGPPLMSQLNNILNMNSRSFLLRKEDKRWDFVESHFSEASSNTLKVHLKPGNYFLGVNFF